MNEHEKAMYEAMVAKERLERVASRLTTAFSIWALVVLAVGAGLLTQQYAMADNVDKFRKEFTAYVVASEARLARLETMDMQSIKERNDNASRIHDLERAMRGLKDQ